MSYDVVVVGGGIGGLTVAALLSARGVKTCLLERQSQVGGCVGKVELAGHDFEPGMGVYPSWSSGEIHERIFSELAVAAPQTSTVESDYVVRLQDGADIRLKRDDEEFFEQLRQTFPECQDAAVEFYTTAARVDDAWAQELSATPVAVASGIAKRFRALFSKPASSLDLRSAREKVALEYARGTSHRFQHFVDAQLRAFANTTIEECTFLGASVAISRPRKRLYSITCGPAAVATLLAEAIKQAGGVVRLNSAVLRLAYDQSGAAIGVDLLSGETVLAKRAIVSNMTIWDTYGKLVGLNRTPALVKKMLATFQGKGAYLIYASMDDSAALRLPAERLLVAGKASSLNEEEEENGRGEFTLAATAASERRAPDGKRAVTLKSTVDVNEWFSFQSSEEDYEQWDQTALELFWERLHRAIPELGSGIEILETATPRTYYELTRRKLGMVLGVEPTLEGMAATSYRTSIPNLFIVGDTVLAGTGLDAVSQTALKVANELTK